MSTIKNCQFPIGNLKEIDIHLYNILQCNNITEMLLKCIEITKQYPPLYTRKWEKEEDMKCESTTNTTANNNTTTNNCRNKSFRALQFNILAEGLSADPKNQPPHDHESNEVSSFGDFITVNNPTVVFDYKNFRRWRLLEEILVSMEYFNQNLNLLVYILDIIQMVWLYFIIPNYFILTQ